MPPKEDAIQQDVSTQTNPAVETDATTTENAEPPKSRRELAMEQLEASRNKAFEAESGEKVVIDDDDDDGGQEVRQDDQLSRQAADEPVVAATPVVEPTADKEQMVRVKVDGEEMDVPLSKVLASYQKNSAADKRLDEATRLLKEAQARAASPAAPVDQVAAQTAAPAAAPAASDEELTGKVRQALSSLYSGDEDEAVNVFAGLLKGNKAGADQATAQPLDVNQVTQAVTHQLEVNRALATIESDYPEILSNRDLDRLTTMKARDLEEQGSPKHVAMLTAAKEVYAMLGKTAGRQGSDGQRTARAEKLAKKERLDRIPEASASTPASTVEDSSPSSVIAQMKAGRLGQGSSAGS